MPVNNVNPADIVDNMTSMGYYAKHIKKPATEKYEAQSRVYIGTGTPKVLAYIDLSGDNPKFNVWAKYEAGHTTGAGRTVGANEINKFNAQERERVYNDLKAPALAAYQCAADGGDLKAIHEGFGLAPAGDRYTPRAERQAEANADNKPAPAPEAAPGM